MEVSIIIDLQVANQICKDALLAYGEAQGLSDVKVEGCVERFVRKRKLLNCKRRGVAVIGTRMVVVPDLSHRDLQKKAKSLGLKADGTAEVLINKIKEAEDGGKIEEIGRKDGDNAGVQETVQDVGRDDSIGEIKQNV